MYDTIFSPVIYGGLRLKNRIIFAPTSFGLPEEAYFEKLRKIAAGGAALLIIGDVPVGKHGAHSLHTEKGFHYYQRLCDMIHGEGALVCAQLHQSDSNLSAMLKYLPGLLTKKISPEDLRRLLNEEVSPYISSMPQKKVSAITASFGPAALLAKKAGFDMIQVHGDRMCGSFSSSLYNKRRDCYGGSPENRARFAAEAVAAVRKALPGMPIDFKLPVRQEDPHYGNAGVLLSELPVFIPILEKAGVTSFHVALGDHGSLTDTIPPASHPYFGGEGCFLPYCDEVRRYTKLPVCGVGSLRDPDFVEKALKEGRIDCAAMSRQLIADPDWPKKAAAGRTKEILRCLRCNRDCLGGIQRHEGVHCIYDKKRQEISDREVRK